jgi:ketosteroid isomerase-like protein
VAPTGEETSVGRLGPWTPATHEERLDRLESLASIRQLAYRYALALDSRDMDAMAALFVPDVRVGRGESGRAALRRWFTEIMQASRTTIHLVANHIVDFDDADHARGIVYCRDQLERPSTGRWEIGDLQYWDDYARVDGEWCFRRRKFHRWYLVDALRRPAHGAGVNDGSDPLGARQLPEAFATWAPYWESVTQPDDT